MHWPSGRNFLDVTNPCLPYIAYECLAPMKIVHIRNHDIGKMHENARRMSLFIHVLQLSGTMNEVDRKVKSDRAGDIE